MDRRSFVTLIGSATLVCGVGAARARRQCAHPELGRSGGNAAVQQSIKGNGRNVCAVNGGLHTTGLDRNGCLGVLSLGESMGRAYNADSI